MRVSKRSGLLEITVDTLGAELASVRRIDTDVEYLWQGDERTWKGRSPVLFPVIGGPRQDHYTLNSRSFSIPSHGPARRKEWAFVDESGNSLSFALEPDADFLACYPFDFYFRITYTIEQDKLGVGFAIENRSDSVMPFLVGAHPGFNCPLEEGLEFSDYFLEFEQDEDTYRHLKQNGWLTGETEPFRTQDRCCRLTHDLFKKGAVILNSFKSEKVSLMSDKGSLRVEVEFPGFTHLGFWTYPDAPTPYICIEPWFGVDKTVGDDPEFFQREGLQMLEPNETFSSLYTIRVC